MLLFLASGSGTLLSASPASANEAAILAPASSWNVDWTDRTCTLLRTFGDAKKPDLLWIEKYAPTEWFQLNLISDDLPEFNSTTPVWLTFGEQAPVRAGLVRSGTAKDGRRTLFVSRTSLTPSDTAPRDAEPAEKPNPGLELSITQIKVKVGGREIIVKTGPLYRPFLELRKCTADIVNSWGLDAAAQAKLSTGPQPKISPGAWFKNDDYPERMLGARKQALLIFRLMVDANGRPTACEVHRSFSEKEFDDLTCHRLMQRARFEPARDASGAAVASYYINAMHWII